MLVNILFRYIEFVRDDVSEECLLTFSKIDKSFGCPFYRDGIVGV